MLLPDQLANEIKKVLQTYRKTRTPESLMNSSTNKPLEYLNLHTSASYFVESEIDKIMNDKGSSELKQLCDLSILLLGFIKYLQSENSERLIQLLEPIKINLWDTGTVNDLLNFNNQFATAINNAAELIQLNASLYKQWRFQQTFYPHNPLLAPDPPHCYSGQKEIPEADMGPRYTDFISAHSTRAILADYW